MPYHKHDCENCRYLGSARIEAPERGIENGKYDFYFCHPEYRNTGRDGLDISIICRFDSRGSHYASAPMEIARRIADEHGTPYFRKAIDLYDDLFQLSGGDS